MVLVKGSGSETRPLHAGRSLTRDGDNLSLGEEDPESDGIFVEARTPGLGLGIKSRRARCSLKIAAVVMATAGTLAFLAIALPSRQRQDRRRRRQGFQHVGAQPGLQWLEASYGTVVQNFGEDCWESCGKKGGLCEGYCGRGNACCRYLDSTDPPECHGVLDFGASTLHTCVAPVDPAFKVTLHSETVQNWGQDCAGECGESGYCQEFCGMGNACCKFADPLTAPECGGITDWGAKDRFTCVAPVHAEYLVAKAPQGSNIKNWGLDCWDSCKEAGLCQEFCGLGNACCKFKSPQDPPECHGITEWGAKDRHTCVIPANPYYQTLPVATKSTVQNWGLDCLQACKDAGYCQEFCGIGNACCQFGDALPRPECMGVQDFGSKDRFTCVAPVNPGFITADPPKGTVVKNWAADCWSECKSMAGYCPEFCGMGNACCRFNSPQAPPECQGIMDFGAKDRHTCVAPVSPVWQLQLNSTVQNWGQDCWAGCRNSPGACPDFCGVGNACCRFGGLEDPPECHGILDWGAKNHHTCVKPVNKGVLVNHYAQDCWEHCNGAGYCEGWCGEGNACCRYASKEDPDECGGVVFWPRKDRHTCVRGAAALPGVPKATGECIPGEVKSASGACRKATGPELMVFYMYQAVNDALGSRVGHWALGNTNSGNVEGVLAHLQRDVVVTCPRKGGINRIIRYVVNIKNPDALFAAPLHYQFGPYIQFENGQCMFNSTQCSSIWSRYGYSVGCTARNTLDAMDPVFGGKPGPVMYSLPGRCPSEPLGAAFAKSAACSISEPGGECSAPDGSPTCTWKAEYAGEIRIDELSGITDPLGFCRDGGVEYDPTTDKGTGTTFWNGRRNPELGRHRADYVRELFKMKYPNYPVTLGEPDCDWRR